MSDIVERLREVTWANHPGFYSSLVIEAADEIERLRREVTEARKRIRDMPEAETYAKYANLAVTREWVIGWDDAREWLQRTEGKTL